MKDSDTRKNVCLYIHLALDHLKGKIREIMKCLDRDRELQTTFHNLIGATRFTTINNRKLLATLRPYCEKQPENWERHEK